MSLTVRRFAATPLKRPNHHELAVLGRTPQLGEAADRERPAGWPGSRAARSPARVRRPGRSPRAGRPAPPARRRCRGPPRRARNRPRPRAPRRAPAAGLRRSRSTRRRVRRSCERCAGDPRWRRDRQPSPSRRRPGRPCGGSRGARTAAASRRACRRRPPGVTSGRRSRWEVTITPGVRASSVPRKPSAELDRRPSSYTVSVTASAASWTSGTAWPIATPRAAHCSISMSLRPSPMARVSSGAEAELLGDVLQAGGLGDPDRREVEPGRPADDVVGAVQAELGGHVRRSPRRRRWGPG